MGDFNLSYENNYEYKIIIKGDKSESSDVEDLEKNLFMPSSPDVSWGYNESGIYFSAQPCIDEASESSLNKNKIKTIELILNNNKEKTYKCNLKKENLYDEDNLINDTYEYYEVDIPKDAYNGKLNSIKMKVTYTSGIIDIQDVTNNQMK